jgi:spore coat polysaccharide biosynthesis protein SpsF
LNEDTKTPLRPVAILQARMGSTRLPGKCLIEIAGRSLLEHCIRGVRRSQLVGRIVVATSDLPEDDAIEAASGRLGVDVFRGSAKDVLARYHGALERFPGEPVIRLTGDCPLMDGGVIDKAIRSFLDSKVDYVSTGASKTYPRGLDVEVFTAAALRRAFLEGLSDYHREHVTPYLYEQPGRFRVATSGHDEDLSSWRLTVDTAEDLEVVKAVIEGLEAAGEPVRFENVVGFVKRHLELLQLNSGVRQKSYLEVG